MDTTGAGVRGFLAGGFISVVLVLAISEGIYQYQCAREPPREDFQCLGPGIERDFIRLVTVPLAILFGGGLGYWIAIEWTGSVGPATEPRSDADNITEDEL